MEEAVTRKFVHEESSIVTSLCGMHSAIVVATIVFLSRMFYYIWQLFSWAKLRLDRSGQISYVMQCNKNIYIAPIQGIHSLRK